MFVMVVVVLPSEFTGGDAHLSHRGQSKVFNSSRPSLTKTTVLAWYTDVMHKFVSYSFAVSFSTMSYPDLETDHERVPPCTRL
jgi:hypothetical protein